MIKPGSEEGAEWGAPPVAPEGFGAENLGSLSEFPWKPSHSPPPLPAPALQRMLLSDLVHGDSDHPTRASLPGRDVLLAG